MAHSNIQHFINKIPIGYSQGIYLDKKYGLTKTVFNDGKSIKIYGEELGGNDFVSLNYYITQTKRLIKPCEMPEQKVVHFLENIVIKQNENAK